MIFRNLFRRKVRSLLTLMGIAIGVAAIVALRAIADGLVSGYTDVFTRSGAHLVLTQAEGSSSAGTLTLGIVDERVGEALFAVPNVRDVAGAIFSFTSMPGIPYFVLFGYDPNQFAIQHFKVVEGRVLDPSASVGQVKEILLGKRAAGNLGKEVGDTLNVYDSAYHIVGIYETGVAFEDGGSVVNLSEAQAIVDQPRQVTAYLLQVQDIGELEATRQQIERHFPDLSTSLTSEVVNKIGGLGTISAFAWGISVTAMLVGGVGMMNTVIMSVFERTQEIGTLRALGWRKRRVSALVLGESVLLSLLGGLMGVGLGVVLVKAVSHLPAVGSLSSGAFTPGLFLQALVVALGLGAIGGLLPAWWASRLVPLEALHYEESVSARRSRRTGLGSLGGIAFRNLWRSRVRSSFTIVGTCVGVLAVVVMGAFAEGFTSHFSTLASGADLMAMQADVSDMEFSAIHQKVGTQIATMPGVQYVSGGISGPAALEETPMFSLHGRDPAEYAIRHFKVVEGNGLSGSRQILLGKGSAGSLKKEVGETLKVLGHTYHIVGIYETGDPIEEYGGVIALREAQSLFGKPSQVSFFSIKVQDPDEVEEVQRRIEEKFPDLSVTKSADFAESLLEIQLLHGGVTGVSLLAVLVGAVALMNTMIMSVFERTRQIGLLRALGWRQRRVLGMVLSESLILTLVGGLVGIVLGEAMIKLLELSPETASIALRFTPALIAQGLVLAAVLGTLGGLYPAWWASRLAPVEALRYE